MFGFTKIILICDEKRKGQKEKKITQMNNFVFSLIMLWVKKHVIDGIV